MKEIENLVSHVGRRFSDLEKMKKDGRKIIGYSAGGYMPEELVLACGAIPVGLIRACDHSMVELAGAYVCRWFDTFMRAQIGLATSGGDPYYRAVDLFVVPVTDNHVRTLADILCVHTDMDIFPYGVPHQKDEKAFEYYLHGINRLKTRLEYLTGIKITDDRLQEAAILCNRERTLLREISEMRKSDPGVISSKDFVMLNHASFIADKHFMVENLESILKGLKGGYSEPVEGPKILLTGPTLAQGDNKVLGMLDDVGAKVVVEEFAEGIKPYWENVKMDGDPMEALADCYFMKRVCPGWFRPGKERLDFLVKLARDFSVDGVVWYHLMYRESYKLESYYFPEILKKETGLSMLLLESDYDPSETGQMRTRIETFTEIIGR